MFSVKKSKVVIDLVEFPESDADPGMGLWQLCEGQFPILVTGLNVQSILKTEVHRDQRPYMMDSGYDEDYVIVPTLDSIRTDDIHIGFRLQHCSINTTPGPTHKMDWRECPLGNDYPYSFPILLPLRQLDIDTELTFNYNLH